MKLVDRAMDFAIRAHWGQINPHDSEPYILHPMRVFIAVREAGLSEEAQAVAWLHDTLEDCEVTFTELVQEFGTLVAHGVLSMTKVKGEPNERYYWRCKSNLLSAEVKPFDINENFGRNHLIQDPATKARMAQKYSLGLDILTRTR